MIVYEVNASDGDPGTTVGTLREAHKLARQWAREVTPAGEMCTVERIHTCRMDRATIIRLMNGAGAYVEKRVTVASYPSRRRREG